MLRFSPTGVKEPSPFNDNRSSGIQQSGVVVAYPIQRCGFECPPVTFNRATNLTPGRGCGGAHPKMNPATF